MNAVSDETNRQPFKSAAKAALRWAAERLPWGVRKTLLEAMIESFGYYEVFEQLNLTYSVTSLTVRGDCGNIEGSPNDLVLQRYMKTRTWAPELSVLLNDLFAANNGGTYLDIGANIGLTTIPVSRSPNVTCYAFEPEPTNLQYLRRNISENCPHGNVSIVPIALFDCRATLKFALSKSNLGDHRIHTEGDGLFEESRWPTIDIEADRLDGVIDASKIKYPLAVKIDTQGAEPNIFVGGSSVLSQASVIALEFCPYMMKRLGGPIDAVIDFLESNFREGSLAAGDSDVKPTWIPINSLAAELRRLTAQTPRDEYFDVVARK
jgi:FkbM family methyltransferase